MKQNRRVIRAAIVPVLLLLTMTSAAAIDSGEVETAIAASSKAEVAGNIFIWFLCAIGFLKVSQKVDSFMASLGVNVGRTGSSMLTELLLAGRAITTASSIFGGNRFTRNHGGSVNTGTASAAGNRATGAAFSGGHGMIGVARRAIGRAATAGATGTGKGFTGHVGGAIFNASMARGGGLAASVISAVALGSMASTGSITGEQASAALSAYLGYGHTPPADGGSEAAGSVPTATGVNGFPGVQIRNDGTGQGSQTTLSGRAAPYQSAADGPVVGENDADGVAFAVGSIRNSEPVQAGGVGQTASGHTPAAEHIVIEDGAAIPVSPSPSDAGPSVNHGRHDTDTITDSAGTFSESAVPPFGAGHTSVPTHPSSAPVYRNVEIGGGRITGYESIPGSAETRQFAMYSTEQYMEPNGDYEIVKTVDGASWYKQYAEPVVKKTPHELPNGKISYDERIVQQMPQIPKRKDRV